MSAVLVPNSVVSPIGTVEGVEPVESAAEQAADILEQLKAAQEVAARIAAKGAIAEYVRFANSTHTQTSQNAFDFIRHACEGTGGFETGTYLDPHSREQTIFDFSTPEGNAAYYGGGNQGSQKFRIRRRLTSYDNFARTIRDTHWGYIQQSKDLIKRDSEIPEVQKFWRNADGKGTDIVDAHAVPWREARMYSFNLIIIDRPPMPDNATLADTTNPEYAAYMFSVPSKNVVWWEFNDTTNALELVAYLEPENLEDAQDALAGSRLLDAQSQKPAPLKVWTEDLWACFVALDPSTLGIMTEEKWVYALDDWAMHPIGEVPCVILRDDDASPGQMYGSTEMKEVSVLAKTVFNIDSEIREVQRNCAFPVLCIPTKDPGTVPSITVSTEGALGFDGPGTPIYLTANLDSLEKLKMDRNEKVQQAFGMAHLAAVIGSIKTSSGFHTMAEFDKSNRRIGRAASQMEDAEMKEAWIVCKWHGYTDEQLSEMFANASDATPGPYSVSYPRDFGIRDYDVLVKRANGLMEMSLGDEVNAAVFNDLFSALWPRFPETKIQSMVDSATAALKAERDAANALAPPSGGATTVASARVQAILKRSGIGLDSGKGLPPAGTVAPPADLAGVAVAVGTKK